MIYFSTIISIIEALLVLVPALLIVAFVTIAERKTMASMQRRLGPNIVGYYGLLQAFADALKLITKEYILPNQANMILFFIGPVITLIFSLLGFAIIPYGPGLHVADLSLGILYLLAVSSLATYGILLAGWSANSKYAFLGSLRSTAQLISYELILTSAILIIILLTGSLNFTINIETQKAVFFLFPILPIFIIFFIGSIAETNRAPFDLAEAESELVSGFMTEHAAVIFVFFFLAEYGSIVLICILNSILFLGGYIFNLFSLIEMLQYVFNNLNLFFNYLYFYDNQYDELLFNFNINEKYMYNILLNHFSAGLFFSFFLALKSCIMIFIFIWVRASFPRTRFDQLMSFCWTVLLPIVIAFIIYIPCLIYLLDVLPFNLIH
jgi:NADH-ubiquinone oxidoreductase chain 1